MIENKQLPMYSIANGEYSCVCPRVCTDLEDHNDIYQVTVCCPPQYIERNCTVVLEVYLHTRKKKTRSTRNFPTNLYH